MAWKRPSAAAVTGPGESFPFQPGRGLRTLPMPLSQAVEGLGGHRVSAGQHAVEEDAEGVEVGRMGGPATLEELRRHGER